MVYVKKKMRLNKYEHVMMRSGRELFTQLGKTFKASSISDVLQHSEDDLIDFTSDRKTDSVPSDVLNFSDNG